MAKNFFLQLFYRNVCKIVIFALFTLYLYFVTKTTGSREDAVDVHLLLKAFFFFLLLHVFVVLNVTSYW